MKDTNFQAVWAIFLRDRVGDILLRDFLDKFKNLAAVQCYGYDDYTHS